MISFQVSFIIFSIMIMLISLRKNIFWSILALFILIFMGILYFCAFLANINVLLYLFVFLSGVVLFTFSFWYILLWEKSRKEDV